MHTDQLLITIRQVAHLLSRSVAALYRDLAAGRLPPPRRLGRSRRWARHELEAWVAAGCPDARTWAAMQASIRRARA